MTVDAETLLIRLEATQRKFERQLAGANRTADRRARSIERRFERMNTRLSRSFAGTLRGLLPAVGGAALVQEFRQLADANTRIQNSLKVTGLEGEGLQAVFDNLFAVAQDNFVPFEALAQLYSRAALAQNELGVTTQELTQFTENVAVALRVSGRSAAESRGALLQLSQAIGGSVVRAEEFNSILEGALPIAQAAARGLEEAGGSVSRLRGLIIEGKVSSEAFFRAFEAGAPSLAAAVETAEVTSSQALTRLGNELIEAAGDFDDATDASGKFVDAVGGVTDNLDDMVGTSVAVYGFLDGLINRLRDGSQAASDLGRTIGERLGADRFGEWLAGTGVGRGANIVLGMESNSQRDQRLEAELREQAALEQERSRFASTFTSASSANNRTVSLDDFDTPAGSGSSSNRQERQNSLEREITQIRQRTEALREETQVLSSLGPFQDDYGAALERTRAVRELLTAAEQAGIEITPELEQQIGALADGYAAASVEAQRLAETQDSLRESAEDFATANRDVLKGFITDLKDSGSAAEALENALADVGSRLLDIALTNVGNAFSSGGGGGGGIGSIFSSIFGGFRARGGPVSSGKAYVVGEEGPELFRPNGGGRIIPNDVIANARAGSRSITMHQQVNVSGTVGAAEIDQAIRQANEEVVSKVPGLAIQSVTDYRRGGNDI